jgi:peptide subunit release factor RF-3
MSILTDEIARRRTFAIIWQSRRRPDHPDQKLLLFGWGDPAGGRSQGARRAAAGALGHRTAVERERGISVSAR